MNVFITFDISSRVRALVSAAALGALFFAALPVRADAPTGQPVDGIRCESMEGSVFHIHQHISVLDHGKPVGIPADVGQSLAGNCLYWIHTHTDDGIVHVEAPAFRTFTLGQFFDVWGQPFTPKRVASAIVKKGERVVVWANGSRVTGSPRATELDQHSDITVEAGPPYTKPAPFTDWKGQ